MSLTLDSVSRLFFRFSLVRVDAGLGRLVCRVQFVERGDFVFCCGCWEVGYDGAFLYVFVSAFTLEAYCFV
jgi:hypothetical protein